VTVSRAGAWAFKRMLFHGGLLSLARLTRQRGRGLVLRYHAITEGPADVPYATPEICLPVEAFRLQMAFVKRAYRPIPLDDLVAATAKGGALPPRAVAITFDDGYADNHRLAAPVLRELGLPATVYVATGTVEDGPPLWMSSVRALVFGATGRELVVPGFEPLVLGPVERRGAVARALTRLLVPLTDGERAERIAAAAAAARVDLRTALRGVMLTWAQVRELASAGWSIGAHTVTHVNVALSTPAVAEAEIAASRDAIAQVVRTPVTHFAYPNAGGEHRYFSNEVVQILRRLGFRSGVTSQPGSLRPKADPFLLPRVGVSPRLAPVIDLAAALERQRLAA
jgi:peptidoglycan/xylan/chitin deacetylase (PgdA/CDA1 family)